MEGKKSFLVFIFFILVTVVYFLPLIRNFYRLLPDDSDGVVITWALNKFVQNPTFNPQKLFQGNILYPYPYTHAYTDPYLVDSIIAYPFVKLSGEPVVAFNVNLLLSQILFLLFFFLFLKQISGNFLVSFLIALVFGFSQIRLHYLGHLQMFSLYWLPATGCLLLKLARSKKPIFLYLFLAAFVFQTLNSFLAGYFVLFLATVLAIVFRELRDVLVKNFKHLILGGVLAAGIIIFYAQPYLAVSSFFHYTRPIRDVVHFSLSPEEIFSAKFFSPVLMLVFVVSLIFFLIGKKKDKKEKIFLAATIFSYVMALGPVLHFLGKTIKIPFPIPLPYFIFYYLFPGFGGFRTPSRWIFMSGFLVITFSCLVLAKTLKKIPKNVWHLSTAVVLILLMLMTKIPKTYYPIPNVSLYPKVYNWLANQPGRVVLEMPIYYWRDSEKVRIEGYRMLYSLVHGKKMINGTTGFTPPEFEEQVEYFKKEFPSRESLLKIKNLRVDYLIVHNDEYQINEEALDDFEEMKEVYRDRGDVVYEFIKN